MAQDEKNRYSDSEDAFAVLADDLTKLYGQAIGTEGLKLIGTEQTTLRTLAAVPALIAFSIERYHRDILATLRKLENADTLVTTLHAEVARLRDLLGPASASFTDSPIPTPTAATLASDPLNISAKLKPHTCKTPDCQFDSFMEYNTAAGESITDAIQGTIEGVKLLQQPVLLKHNDIGVVVTATDTLDGVLEGFRMAREIVQSESRKSALLSELLSGNARRNDPSSH